MDAIIALLIAYATRAARAAADEAKLANPITPTTWVCCGHSDATAAAWNAEIERIADEACRAYYETDPEGNWDEAHQMHYAITMQKVTAPRSTGGFAIYPR